MIPVLPAIALAVQMATADQQYATAYESFKQGDPVTSLAEYEKAAKLRPPNAADYQAIGGDYFLLEDYVSADKWLSKAVELDPDSVTALYFLGRARYNRKFFAQAAELFEKCVALDPNNAKAEQNLGLAYEQLGKKDQAVAAYDSASKLGDPEAYLHLGILLGGAAGLPALVRAVELMPNDAAAHRELGKAYLSSRMYEQARTELQHAVELDPQAPQAHYMLAQTYQHIGERSNSEAEMRRYEELAGVASVGDDPLGEARGLANKTRWDDAAQVLQRYLKVHRYSGEAHYMLGYVLLKQQNPQASLVEYTEAARYRVPSALDLGAVASDYVLLGDYTDADKWFSKSLEMDPKNAQTLYYLGRTKYAEKLLAAAAHCFQSSLQLQPSNAAAHRELGRVYLEQGKKTEAQAELEASLKLEPGQPETERLLEQTK